MKAKNIIQELRELQYKLEANINLLGQILREHNLVEAFKEDQKYKIPQGFDYQSFW